MLKYSETIETQGVRIPFVAEIITPRIERPIRRNRYEGGECQMLQATLRAGDTVLELGAGLGLCSTIAAITPGVERVVAIEANPALIPLIRETHRLNGAENVELLNGVVTANGAADTLEFFLREDFWASSIEESSRPFLRKETLPAYDLNALIRDVAPSVIVCDIEGGEFGLFDAVDLSGVRSIVIELHAKIYGPEGVARILGGLSARGFHPSAKSRRESSVQLLERRTGKISPLPNSAMPSRSYQDWPIKNPRVLVATCMKNEGPFILEWLAWHRFVGVTDFVVFTNDCTDGTIELLDRLQERGELVHLPNPALVSGNPAFQPVALSYVHHIAAFRSADFFISMDVDEFINVRTGDRTLRDLFAATGPFDALSMTELNHGSNRKETFQPGWVTEQFPAHQTERPGKLKSRRGVKTIVRLSDEIERVRNHRPNFLSANRPVLWLDGSGRFTMNFVDYVSENGHDCRGTYDLVSLDHFPLRSLESYLVKMLRGDVVVKNKRVSRAYWRVRNRNDTQTSNLAFLVEKVRTVHAERFESDPVLMQLHRATCDAHRDMITELLKDPVFQERREQILANHW